MHSGEGKIGVRLNEVNGFPIAIGGLAVHLACMEDSNIRMALRSHL